MVQMRVKLVAREAESGKPIMILTDLEEKRILPIWIGVAEAAAILSELEGETPARPMTHDLMKNLCELTGLKLQRVVVNDLQDSTFYARLIFDAGGRELDVDARPSDSVALAMRYKAPIFVAESVIQQAAHVDPKKIEEENKKFRTFMENISPDFFTVPQAGTKDPEKGQSG